MMIRGTLAFMLAALGVACGGAKNGREPGAPAAGPVSSTSYAPSPAGRGDQARCGGIGRLRLEVGTTARKALGFNDIQLTVEPPAESSRHIEMIAHETSGRIVKLTGDYGTDRLVLYIGNDMLRARVTSGDELTSNRRAVLRFEADGVIDANPAHVDGELLLCDDEE
jgi:hypothetical protein